MSKKSNLNHQFINEVKKETRFGESKHEAKQKNRQEAKRNHEKYEQVKGIFSRKTYNDYCSSLKVFTNYIVKNHSEVKNIEQCKRYIPEYVDYLRDEKGLSEWTVHTYIYALRAAYHCEVRDLDVTLKTRSRADVIRCRDAADSAYRQEERYRDTINMVKATGCRRMEILRLRKEDFREKCDRSGNKTGEWEVHKRGKGGIDRWCLVNPSYVDFVKGYLNRATTISQNGEERLFRKADIPAKLAVHDLRSDYACDLYRYYERCGYGNGDIYHCRKDLKGYHYDKGILDKVSFDLQHARDNVVIDYLWKMR